MADKYKVILTDNNGETFSFSVNHPDTSVDETDFGNAASKIAAAFGNADVTSITLTSETTVWTAQA